MQSSHRFGGKIAVVTGAASGIGREAAMLFAREGATVFAADIDRARLEVLECEVANLVPELCDVREVAQVERLMNSVADRCGGIDLVLNNAGSGGARETIDAIDADGWDRTMDLLLRSVAMGIRFATPHMKGRAGAAIVNMSSVAAVGPGYSPVAYAVAKAGVLHLTKCAAADLARYGIRVNAVQPGFINTNIFATALGISKEKVDAANELLGQLSALSQPVARGGQSADIAEAVAFLCSDASSFMTGTSLVVDGGLTLGPRLSWDPEAPGWFDAVKGMAEKASPDVAQRIQAERS